MIGWNLVKKSIVRNMLKCYRDVLLSISSLNKINQLKSISISRVLLITNGGFSGAPLVLLEAAEEYRKLGFDVTILAESNSGLSKECKKRGIRILVFPYMKERSKLKLLKAKFDLVFVNTIVMYDWAFCFSKYLPVIWWIHEGDTYIEPLSSTVPHNINKNIKVYTVGNRPLKSLEKYNFNYYPEILFYGVPDMRKPVEFVEQSKFRILIIGSICKRKNQIAVVNAFSQLEDSIKKNCELVIVGAMLDGEDAYYQKLRQMIDGQADVIYIERVTRDKIPKLYHSIDLLVCASIDDPLPVVVTEGLMFGKLVVVSSETGQHEVIEDGANGFRYNINTVGGLADSITKAYNARNNEQIKINARETYERLFSSEVFSKRIYQITENVLNKRTGTCE